MNYMPYQNQAYPQHSNGIIWVQGIEGAKAYQLMPNSNAVLMDSENDGRLYVKVSDNIGMCTLRTFKYEEVLEEKKPQADFSNYVTREELEQAIKELKGAITNAEQSVSATGRSRSKQYRSDLQDDM